MSGGFWLAWGLAAALAAEGQSVSPFIDAVKKELGPEKTSEGSGPDPYLQKVKKSLPAAPDSGSGSFIESAKKENPAFFHADDKPTLDKEKARLGKSEVSGGAIAAVKEGRSELHAKMEGQVSRAYGLRVGAAMTRAITAGDIEARPFEAVYLDGEQTKWSPDVAFTFEWLPFGADPIGSFFIGGSGGGTFNRGSGAYSVQLRNYQKANADGSHPFFDKPATNFEFITLPVSVTAGYRLSGLRYIQPFASAGIELVPYLESRSDGVGGTQYGSGRAALLEAGAWIQLDWLSKSSAWDMYADYGVRHLYLTVAYLRSQPIASQVNFEVSGVYSGLAFEF